MGAGGPGSSVPAPPEMSSSGRFGNAVTMNPSAIRSGTGAARWPHPRRVFGGGLTIESAPGQDAAVSMSLPEAAAKRDERDQAEPRQPPVDASAKTATILVVDDEQRMRRLARRILYELGYQVLEAENAAAAARLLETDISVDLLFTDVVMPGATDGRDLGYWARQHRPGLKVLLTSGFPQRAPDEGIPGGETLPLLKKPYSKEQLQAAIRTLLYAQAS